MGLLTRLFGSTGGASSRDPLDDFWFSQSGSRPASGVNVTVETALTVPAVLDCLSILSQTIASLSWGVFERLDNGDRRPARNHPLVALFENPDGECTAHEFWAQMVMDLAGGGNALYRVDPGPLGFASALKRMEGGRTLVERVADGSRRWQHTDAGGITRTLVEGEVWHLRDLPLIDGLVGNSRIHSGREAIGALLALQEYGARFFLNDATPPMIFHHPGQFKDQASKQNFLNAIQGWFGIRRRAPAVLEFGIKAERVATTNEEAQFLETRKELQLEVSRIWRMPPHKLGALERATNNNIEHQSIEFVTDTVGPWIDLIESSVNRHLILNKRRFFFEFNVASLLRGDIKARFEAYAQGRQWGWLSVNEIRRMENLNPIGSRGDEYLQPMNMTPAGSAPQAEAFEIGSRGQVKARRVNGEWSEIDGA